jgi:hypothetical protein
MAWAAAMAACGALVMPDAGAWAIDCTVSRKDYKAICGNPDVKSADERREAEVARIMAALPKEEREAFSLFEDRWELSRNSVCSTRINPPYDAIDIQCLRRLIDNHVKDLRSIEGGDGLDGRLRFGLRRGPNREPNIAVVAEIVEFDQPRTSGERLFNQLVAEAAAKLPLTETFDTSQVGKLEQKLLLSSLYRSATFISAGYEHLVCCGSHGMSYARAINVDLRKGEVFSPRDTLRLGLLANACRLQFELADDLPLLNGPRYPAFFSLKRNFRDDDFEPGTVVPYEEGTVRTFSEILNEPRNWAFSRSGAEISFGFLQGYASGPYLCHLTNAELNKMTRAGVKFPL